MYISHVRTAACFELRAPRPKTVTIVPKQRRSANFVVYNVRLLSTLDKLLRDKPRYMGELSTSINDALLAIDLNTVELVNLQSRQKQTGRETQVVILRRLRQRIHQVAHKRQCSMNQLVNSALLAYYSKTGEGKVNKPTKGRGVSMCAYDTMSELERRELHKMLSGLSAVQPLDSEVDEPDGTYYEYDRNLKATVKVTPDGERTPVTQLEEPFERAPQKGQHKTPQEGMTT
jgi:hypothetical protein